ncbi:MAG: DUF4091 domain-containing protein [Planctomycetota bacterium]
MGKEMKKLVLCLLLAVIIYAPVLIAADSSEGKSSLALSFVDELEDIFPDSECPEPALVSASLDVPRGGIAGIHILLNGLREGEELGFGISESGRAVAEAKWYRLLDVPVEKNTGLKERLGTDNPHVIRKAPFRVFDVLEPAESPVKIKAETVALRLEIPISSSDEPGTRQFDIELKTAADTRKLTLELNIHKAVLPSVGKDSIHFTNWFNLEKIATHHNVESFSPEYWEMLEKYSRLMSRSRQNTFWVPLSAVFEKQEDNSYLLNRNRLRRMVELFTDAGMYYIEGGHVASRTNNEWMSKTFSILNSKGPIATSREGDRLLSQICKQLMEEIEANGWRDRWIQHISDEPVETHAGEYRIIAGMVRKYMPGLPILEANMEATMAGIELYGAQDIWCPKANSYEDHKEAYDEMKSRGDQVWFYTCLDPRGPYVNRLMDQERMRPMLMGWGAALYDLDGFLHWGLNWYPFEPPQAGTEDRFSPTVAGNLPPGDTHVVYPGVEGPLSSTRLEANRIGFEDYELLKMLKAKDAECASAIVNKVIRSFSDYTKEPEVYRAARKELLESLD